MTQITMEGVRFLLAGTFDFVTDDDARWALIARGAIAETSVGRRTHVVIAGDGCPGAVIEKARSLNKPILGKVGLEALLGGKPLPQAITADGGKGPLAAASSELAGKTIVVSGKLRTRTKDALARELEQRGAQLAKRASTSTSLLVLGPGYKDDAIDALEAGVPSITEAQLEEIFAGAPLTRFVGEPTDEGVRDPEAHVRALVERHVPALRELAAGEVQRFDETLTVTLHPDGRVAIVLSIFRGTPLEETARSLLRAERFPRVRSLVRVETKLVLGAA
jgi:BRCT domain type II-containing protein